MARADLASILIALALGVTAFNAWQRWDWTYVSTSVRNQTAAVALVRVVDGTTGVATGTWEVPPHATARIVEGRPERWFAEIGPVDHALGRRQGFVLELLAYGACRLLDVTYVDDDVATVDARAGSFTYDTDSQMPTAPTTRPAPAIDPCNGSAAVAPAEGVIANLTTKVAVVGSGFTIDPCSLRTVRPGEITTSGGDFGQGSIHFTVPSIEAQDERWPLQPRTVRLTREGVSDEADGGGFDPDEFDVCRGSAPR